MMENVKGVVDMVSNNGRGFLLNGWDGWFSAFEPRQLQGAKKGDYVQFMLVRKPRPDGQGEYMNVRGDLTVVEGGAQSTAKPSNQAPVTRDVSINVGHAINVATSIVAANVNVMEAVSDEDIAKRVFALLPLVYSEAMKARELAANNGMTYGEEADSDNATDTTTLEEALNEDL